MRNVFTGALGAGLLSLLPAGVLAQDGPETVALAFGGADWQITAAEARIEQIDGREALFLQGGRAWLDDLQFEDGVIEFDLRMPAPQMGFAGLGFRAQDPQNFEDFYLRAHLSDRPDASQYMPVINGLGGWQIYHDAHAAQAIPFEYGEWMRVRAVIEGDRADFYLDDDTPFLHVPDLKGDFDPGMVGLRAGGRIGFHFANFSARPLNPGEGVIGTAAEVEAPPQTLIRRWSVSEPIAETTLTASVNLPEGLLDAQDWSELAVETNGIANLARAAEITPGERTLLTRLTLTADQASERLLRFGYSDRARIYLNGELLFAGDAGWRTRDYRFLGTVGLFDAVGLQLEAGENTLVIAVSETFGGWAVMAELEDQSGITIAP